MIIAKKIKTFSPNFALFKIDPNESIICYHHRQRIDIQKTPFNGVIGVNQIDFIGRAKGKTGKHSLRELEEIRVHSIRMRKDAKGNIKFDAYAWDLVNQEEIDTLYFQRLNFNI